MERSTEPSRTISRAAFARQALGRLSNSLGPDIAQQVCLGAGQHQRALKARRPQGWSLGMRYVLRNMEWSLALYRAALEHGLSREQAGELVEEINWLLSEPTVKTLFRLSRLRSSQLRIRLRWMYDAMFALLFTAPFKRRVVASKD